MDAAESWEEVCAGHAGRLAGIEARVLGLRVRDGAPEGSPSRLARRVVANGEVRGRYRR
jgi:hypothetical protein